MSPRSFAPLVALLLCLFAAATAHAQVTTANIRGVVKSADDGVPIAEAEVTLIDEAVGTRKTTTTNADGVFVFANLRIGGPYWILADVPGFKTAEEKNITLTAGKTRDVTLGLKLQTEEIIEVKSTNVTRSTSGRTVVTSAEIDALPTVGRDPRDFVRRSAEVSVEGRDKALSIGGQNTRFNSITVDGIRQDDDFGLNQSGYPTRRSPIAVSAIEELAVESSPFDVRYGKFLGGNVNIVTKSGTNELKGELVGTYSSDAMIGDKSKNDAVNVKFREVRYGATVGGPIMKDKVHFLASVEGLGASVPVDVGAAGSGSTITVAKVSENDVAEAQRIAREVYGFNAGVPSRSLDEGDLKLLAKVDWAIDKKHRLSTIYQRTGGNSIQNAVATDSTLPLSSNWFDSRDTLHTFSARMFSDWNEHLSTQVELAGKLVASRVDPLDGNGFMAASIKTADGGTILLGPDEFRHANTLDNDVLHGKVEANYLFGKHLFTAGSEYDLLRIRNLFVPFSNGSAQYASLAAFEAMQPTSISYTNSVTLDPRDAAANWNAGTFAAYLQDQLKLTGELSIQGGLRMEVYQSGDTPTTNSLFIERYGFSNNETLNGRSIIMPRIGISYLPDERLNLRAGGGLYSGGTPTVWVSNNYSNDGVRIASAFSNNASVVGGFNGRDIPQGLQDMIKPGNGNVDALDPDFRIPSTWKVGAGADAALGVVDVKVNYTFSKARDAVMWIDLRRDLDTLPNNLPVGETVDGRPLYSSAFNTRRGFDMLLTNTSRGYGHVASVVVQKGFPWGLYLSGSYAFQRVYEVSPATSSRSVSNYELAAIVDPQNPDLAISNYQREHRLTAAIEFSRALVADFSDAKLWKNMKTSVGIFAESRSGQPFSWTFGDANQGDTLGKIFGEEREFARRNREQFYVPRGDGSDVILNGIDPGEFEQFLKDSGLDKYRGQIVPRNAFKSPWFNKIDMRFAQDLPNPVNNHRARFVFDIENVGNMLHDGWGRATSVPFPFMQPAVDVQVDAATGKYIYSNLRPANPARVDILASVWRMSFGLIYDF